MLTKLLTLLHSKVAIAAVGAALVGTTGVAVAATQGKIALPGAATTHGSSATHAPQSTAGAIHAHTVTINGTLVSCAGGAGIICVKDAAGKTWQVRVNDSTKRTGDHALIGKDLATLTGHRVVVQATAESDGSYVAWKVTLIGSSATPGADDHGDDHGDAQGSDDHGSGGAATQPMSESGTIAAVSATGFTLALPNGTQQVVTVSTDTTFAGMAHQLSDLHPHMHVAVQGTPQSGNTLLATRVEASA